MDDFLIEQDKDIFSRDERNEIERHLTRMKCDPKKIGSWIWFLEHTEMQQMKYMIWPNYKGDRRSCVFHLNTKAKGDWLLTKSDMKKLERSIDKLMEMLQCFCFDGAFTLLPVSRDFYQTAKFNGVAEKVSHTIRSAFPMLRDLRSLLKEAISLASFTRRGRNPKEGASDFAYHIVHHFFISFKSLPSATTRNSHFEKIVEICYRAVGIEATDLHKIISKAIDRYKHQLPRACTMNQVNSAHARNL
jgi:hypothetical protein